MMEMFGAEPVSLQDIITGDMGVAEEPAELQTFFVRALYDYQSSDASSLSFRRGALIEVLTQLESGWWDGLLGEERGWFPSNYVEILTDEEADAELAAREAPAAAMIAHALQPIAHGAQGWVDERGQYVPSRSNTVSSQTGRMDDFWVPQVTGSGQVFYVNTRTGEQSADLPVSSANPLVVETGYGFAPQGPLSQSVLQQQPVYDTVVPPPTLTNGTRSRSNTHTTNTSTTSASASTAAATSTPATAAFTPVSRDDEVHAPWVKRTVEGGLADFYLNEDTGEIRWSAPSPVQAVRGVGSTRLPPLIDMEEGQDLFAGPDVFIRPPVSSADMTANPRSSVYSDDSDVRPISPTGPQQANDDPSASSGSPHHASVGSGQDSGEHHDTASQPTSIASMPVYEGPSGEDLARDLQSMLLPEPAEKVDELSNEVREAIAAVVEAVGTPQEPTGPTQPTEMALKVATVVTSVRNLLYTSGTLNPFVNVHLSRQYGNTNYVEEALQESGRTPLHELKQYQRKVTATLSKLVLSARAADSNPDWPYDDAATRVDNDAAELERAVLTFVMEVKKIDALGTAPFAEKRLLGALLPGDGLGGVGTAIYGAGFAGEWKGMGFVPIEKEDVQVFPQWDLGEETLKELNNMKAVVEHALGAFYETASLSIDYLVPHTRYVLSQLTSFLALAEDIDVARTLDLDGNLYPSSHALDPKLVDDYTTQVNLARKFIRKLEVDKQAVYDDGTSVWTYVQAILRDTNSDRPLAHSLHLDISQWPGPWDLLKVAADSLKSGLTDTLEDYTRLYEVSKRQEDANRQGLRGSIGLRDGQISSSDRRRMSIAGLPVIIDGSHLTPFEIEDPIGEEGDLIDVGDALSYPKGKVGVPNTQTREEYLHHTTNGVPGPRPPLPPLQTPSSRPSSTIPGYTEDGDGASTIGPGTEVLPPYGDEEDDEYELYPGQRKPPSASPQTAKTNDKAMKLLGIQNPEGAKSVKPPSPPPPAPPQPVPPPPWYLLNENDDKSILVNPDGSVRGGTLRALVERLTLHNYRNTVFNDTFLITFKSFTTVDELFDLLVERYNIREPEGLKPDEHDDWIAKKRTPIRLRVINVFRSMLTESTILEKEDMHILDRIDQFADTVEMEGSAKQLKLFIQRARHGEASKTTATIKAQPPMPIIPKQNKALKFLDVDHLEMARQLTIMESKWYLKIRPMECLQRAKEGSGEDDSIKKIITISNKIASWVAVEVLSKDDHRRRASIIKQFILIADKCRELQNYSTMAALIAGLNSPPIRRLKRTWDALGNRMSGQLDEVEKTLDSGKNFTAYRQLLANTQPPCIPFFGVYLTTLTFIQDGNKDMLQKESNLINFGKRQKAAEVIREIKKYQAMPYNLQPLPTVQDFIEESLRSVEHAPDPWELSNIREPREREDEKMARLLQESGFL